MKLTHLGSKAKKAKENSGQTDFFIWNEICKTKEISFTTWRSVLKGNVIKNKAKREAVEKWIINNLPKQEKK